MSHRNIHDALISFFCGVVIIQTFYHILIYHSIISSEITKMTPQKVMIKLGGSLITDKNVPHTIRYNSLKMVVQELKESLDTRPELSLLIGHGGGSFPHPIARAFRTIDGFGASTGSVRGFVLCQNAASTLNRLIIDLMVDYGLDAVSIQPSACCVAADGRIARIFYEPIEQAMRNGIIPVVFGDCVFDEVRGCTVISTEQILKCLSQYIRPDRVLCFEQVGGVYTADPLRDKDAKLIPEINEENIRQVESYLGGAYSANDVTGGMRDKVHELLEIARMGIECEILRGDRGYVKRVLMGERGLGTIINPVFNTDRQTKRKE